MPVVYSFELGEIKDLVQVTQRLSSGQKPVFSAIYKNVRL